VKPAKTSHGKQQAGPAASPAALPYKSVERLRFRDGKYVPMADTDTTIPAHETDGDGD
jgi:hypothetical protein